MLTFLRGGTTAIFNGSKKECFAVLLNELQSIPGTANIKALASTCEAKYPHYVCGGKHRLFLKPGSHLTKIPVGREGRASEFTTFKRALLIAKECFATSEVVEIERGKDTLSVCDLLCIQ